MSVTIVSTGVQPIPAAEMLTDDIPVIDENTKKEYEKIAIRRLVRKLDRRLIPFLFLLEMESYMNRVSIGRKL
jgi:hypothetical protein